MDPQATVQLSMYKPDGQDTPEMQPTGDKVGFKVYGSGSVVKGLGFGA